MMAHILLVDDEQEIAQLVRLYLENEGHTVTTLYDGGEAAKAIDQQEFDFAILDVMLPGQDGFSLCARIRQAHNYPVMMLTARTEDTDKINGLAIGADDYLTKPFNPLELVARVKAQLRRYTRYNQGQPQPLEQLDIRGLRIDHEKHECFLYDQPVPLTPTEFDILWLLASNRGRVFSAEELFGKVWGEEYLESNNTVMVHIRRLRAKLGENTRKPKFIKTVWGVGYKIE
ncbi:MAG TPA: VanR-ABDEGLN family response regulator transcription factor [Candidatus Anaerofilum faecale]|nr:VanR-ABDEGLN family response regulator transcription factor [Candidatus Anaerofilum faecale]